MTEAFTKLFNSIITSSIWSEDDKVRIMWITMLASADASGFVTGTVPGMADMARMSLENAEKSIKALTEPDPYSRSKEYAGRRLLVTEGGWLIANYTKYREKRDPEKRRKQNREAQRRFKGKQKVSQSKPEVSRVKPKKAQAEAEADKEKEKPVCVDKNDSFENSTKPPQVSEFMECWNAHETLPKIINFTLQRKRALSARSKELVFVENWQAIIDKLSGSPWHIGQNDRGWRADVDWILKNSTNYVKILELAKPEFSSRIVTEEEAERLMAEVQRDN